MTQWRRSVWIRNPVPDLSLPIFSSMDTSAPPLNSRETGTPPELSFPCLCGSDGRPWQYHHRKRRAVLSLVRPSTADFHKYSILRTKNDIIFYIDNVSIRLFIRTKSIGNYYITTPMYLYGSIFKGGKWITCVVRSLLHFLS